MPSKKTKSSSGISKLSGLTQKYKFLVVLFVGLVAGTVGTLTLNPSSAFYRNSLQTWVAQGTKMGDNITLTPYYGKNYKNPSIVGNCWHLNPAPAGWPDSIGSYNTSQLIPSTPGMFTTKIQPVPTSGNSIVTKLGEAGTGPAVCKYQLFDGSKEIYWVVFGVN